LTVVAFVWVLAWSDFITDGFCRQRGIQSGTLEQALKTMAILLFPKWNMVSGCSTLKARESSMMTRVVPVFRFQSRGRAKTN
jgi:hypothetical protein